MTDKELEERIESYYDGGKSFPLYQDSWGIFTYACAHDSPSRHQIPSLLRSQPINLEYSRDNVAGTIVGFWTPEIFHGVSVAGYHLALHLR